MNLARSLASARIAVGAAALVAPTLAARAFGFPAAHDSGTARAMGRLFGVREVVIGVLGLRLPDDPEAAGGMYRLQACVDAGDAAAMTVALVKRDGIDRAALSTLVVALGAAGSWTYLARGRQSSP
jgi:hypothetical protein